MKIVYITAESPWGKGETFIMEEMLYLQQLGIDLLIIPRNPPKDCFHREAQRLLDNAVWLPLISFHIVVVFIKLLFTRISVWSVLGDFVRHSRTPWIFIKNLSVLPKGAFLAEVLQKEDICHIHAHWGSTTSTMAYVVSYLTGITWSFTLHAWDIKRNNLLEAKVKRAKFTRCISQFGERELLNIVGDTYKKKTHVIHMGVRIPDGSTEAHLSSDLFKIAVPANLVEKKGHEYLIEALLIMARKGVRDFRCIFYGDGPMRTRLANLIKEKDMESFIEMPGVIAHEKLMEMYKNRNIDLVVLPSIVTSSGKKEGIPVSLMEAMAHGIPVVSTITAGIPELLSPGAGIIVEERSSEQLANAITNLMADSGLRHSIGMHGYQRIIEEFNISGVASQLLKAMKV